MGERRIAQSNAVVATNMSLVWAWVNGDAVGPRLKHRGGEFAGVRVTGISGVPDQRDFVEVNTKLYHGASSRCRITVRGIIRVSLTVPHVAQTE